MKKTNFVLKHAAANKHAVGFVVVRPYPSGKPVCLVHAGGLPVR